MIKKVIIDAGHGINTKGKSSPDCDLMEWRYNRILKTSTRNITS